MLKISQLARQTGLSTHTLRYYEKNGLISASTRSEAGYRLYDQTAIKRVEFVQTARRIGFSLSDIAQLLSIRVDKRSHSCREVTDITRNKLEQVEAQITELQGMRATLNILLESCCGGPENATHCSIMEALEENEAISSAAAARAGDSTPAASVRAEELGR